MTTDRTLLHRPSRRLLLLAGALALSLAASIGMGTPVSGEPPTRVAQAPAAKDLEPAAVVAPTAAASSPRSAIPPVDLATLAAARTAAAAATPVSKPVVVVAAAIIPPATSSAYRRDVYFRAGYERQVDGRTCTAASSAMMMNYIARRDLNLRQMTILRYEQPRDALNDAVQHGSDPLGWAKAATYFSAYTGHPTTYAWQAYGTKSAALKAAARAIARYGKPVGIVAWGGGHAIVMTGFEASRNPSSGDFTLRYIWTSDPYTRGITVGIHRQWTASSFAFTRYNQTDATPKYDKLWIGKYIIIAPTN